MTALEQNLLAIIQDAFPLEERPYQVLAGRLGSDEQSTFAAVESLRKSGVIRRIGGVYDSRRLGFVSRLCAGKVADIDRFAATVNEISAITHNYVRSHKHGPSRRACPFRNEEAQDKHGDGYCRAKN